MNCCICNSKISGFGNNPWPVKDEGQCCDICNLTIVLEKRIERLNKRKEEIKNDKRNSADKCQ